MLCVGRVARMWRGWYEETVPVEFSLYSEHMYLRDMLRTAPGVNGPLNQRLRIIYS